MILYAYNNFQQRWPHAERLALGHGDAYFARPSGVWDVSCVNREIVETTAQNAREGKVLWCHDLEAWDFRDDWDWVTSEFEYVAWTFRKHAPHRRQGFYSQLPFFNYWVPVRMCTTSPDHPSYSQRLFAYLQWQRDNARHKHKERDGIVIGGHGLADQVDVVFPSLYTYYPDRDGWQMFAEESLKQAAIYDKPIVAWLWGIYHDRSAYIGDAFVMQQLTTCLDAEIEGVVFLEGETDKLPQSFFDIVEKYTLERP